MPIENRGTFLGYPMMQSDLAIPAWEKMLTAYPFERIVELGTGRGALSLFFALFCAQNGKGFFSFDNACRLDKTPLMTQFVVPRFRVKDVLKETNEVGAIIARPGRSIVLCDNGNKKKEAVIYSRFLKPSDIIALHDWKREVRKKDLLGVWGDLEFIKQPDKVTAFFMKKGYDPCTREKTE